MPCISRSRQVVHKNETRVGFSCDLLYIADWCNGSTTGFEPVGVGSKPSSAAKTHFFIFPLFHIEPSAKACVVIGSLFKEK